MEVNSMPAVMIKRTRTSSADPKQVLRAYIDRLPLDKQREFVMSAFQLMSARRNGRAMEFKRVTGAARV